MVLTNDDFIGIIEKGASKEMRDAREVAKKINMHVTGKGTVEFLEDLDSYENNQQKKLREQLVKSNRALFSYLLRPMDKIFTAKGGSVNFNLEKEEIDRIKDELSEASEHLDIKRYLKKNVKLPYIMDANAILFVDISPESKLEPHICYSSEILWYAKNGNKVEAIVFEGVKKTEKDEKGNVIRTWTEYRCIDEKRDVIFIHEGNTLDMMADSEIENYFGYVPAMILGDEKNPNADMFMSSFFDVVDEADIFLRRASVMSVHELAHLYPRYWAYAQACTKCQGEGQIDIHDAETDTWSKETCSSCGGDGVKSRTSASDETVVPLPQDGEPVVTPHIAGYVAPDTNTAKFYNDLQKAFRDEMFQDIWGTTYEQGGKRETATGRFIDAKPVEDKLRDMSATFEHLHKFLLDTFVKKITGNKKYESSVTYGTRYILESADDILKSIKETSSTKMSDVIRLDLQSRYIEAEYQTDSVELKRHKKLMKVEPYPTLSVTEVMAMPLPDTDKLMKLYFAEWTQTQTNAQVILKETVQLKAELLEFINQKSLQNEQTNEQTV